MVQFEREHQYLPSRAVHKILVRSRKLVCVRFAQFCANYVLNCVNGLCVCAKCRNFAG